MKYTVNKSWCHELYCKEKVVSGETLSRRFSVMRYTVKML